ncbi:hypothetical protein K493DRAFT_405241 [Basidiobolus meristosporus CBS 931.73]|uniref:RGS domain-containing protein n=1 Tax=Basidiobolus meristosporus CBS 931.73 TaxID=1314790 RepID=A0A1Y1YXA4_9FUNG|nr:hypothetical protein K493DRAFT_405241 [Basidiobolus meristosporus CBS 931.73]|eukprot:ORY02650.1 hypothetical protein K493DRAFT_405241 [Basidiobolus meristosporus CBS 931.73]
MIGVAANIVLSTVYLMGPVFASFLPCFVTLWFGSLLTPVTMLTTVGKFLRVTYLYRSSLAKLKAERRRQEGLKEKSKTNSIQSNKDQGNEPSIVLLTIDSSTNLKLSQDYDIESNWIQRHSYIFEDRFLIRILGGLTLFHIALTVAVQAFTQNYSFTAPLRLDCFNGWEYIPVYVIGSCEIFLFGSIVIRYIRGVSDAYNIVKELSLIVMATGTGFFLHLLFSYTPALYDVRAIIPRAKNYLNGRKLPSFEEVLEHPILFEKFKAFTVKDFSIENALFYERYLRLRTTPTAFVKNHDPAKEDRLPVEIRAELKSIYETFIQMDSDYQVNLKGEIVAEIERKIREDEYALDMLDQALTEEYPYTMVLESHEADMELKNLG